MQDRFRFRVWQTELQVPKMKYNSGIGFIKNQLDDTDCVIMQCTGLRDKNGTLIFEGDIVKITKTTWQKESYSLVYLVCNDTIQWQLGLFKHQRKKSRENRRPDRKIPFKRIVSFDDYTPKRMFVECEVIGNIYENPELIGGEE